MNNRLLLPALLAFVLLTACHRSRSISPPAPAVVAEWRCFDRASFHVVIKKAEILVHDEKRLLRQKGEWAHHQFSFKNSQGETLTAAIELKDESLEVHMASLDPKNSDVVVCTKTYRGDLDDQIYHPRSSYGKITYPPPPGAIQVGMLEADMLRLPWSSQVIDFGCTNSEVGPNIYHYRSDNPRLPELLVTVYKGRVIDLSGGAEEIDPSFPSAPQNPSDSNWIDWLLNLAFRR